MIVPIQGFLNVKISDVFLKLKIALRKVTTAEGRILPQINVTDCYFELDSNKIRFDFGGDLLLHIAQILAPTVRDIVNGPIEKLVYDTLTTGLPKRFNDEVIRTNGYLTFSDLITSIKPGSALGNLTLDYQLENDIKIGKMRLEFGINGTFFNKDKGYYVPNVKYNQMPLYEPENPAKI